ncbi:MAG: DUF1588 domain-containing protein [Archangium sp.]|nr:DUF1588 domain-containing protein [Archangium sp.]MDP3158130.1 DUF1588 domain-containing protein [Archangium sp.]MDP3570463.1 DUF1588 domain-containing protein [Archangium sp.]
MRIVLIIGLLTLSLSSCTGLIDGPRSEPAPEAVVPGEAPTTPGSVTPPPVVTQLPAPIDPEAPPGPPVFPRAGIRRLTSAELQAATSTLLGAPAPELATAIGADMRQSGFTRNADQRVGSVQADALWQAAQALAHDAVVARLTSLAPCATAAGTEACAQTFIHAFAARAFRRDVTPEEETALLTVYRAGQTGSTYAAGIELTITAVLQSPSFLYVTELGGTVNGETTTLSGEEIATGLSLLLTGAPADDALMAAGRAGELATAAGRETAARALLATPAAHQQVARLVLEWTGADSAESLGKDTTLFPEWPLVRTDMQAESRFIVDSVLFGGDGTLESLLSTSNTVMTPALARFYGLTGSGPMTQPAHRKGLLLAGGFAAANAHFADTAPMKRGAVVRKKLLCQELPLPSAVGVNIVVPAPDATLTTRERFSAHSANPTCAGCHKMLDPIGFALESFDAVGRYRTTENGKPIDASGELLNAGDAEGTFTDAVGLSTLLAKSQTVARCFQQHLFRFAAGRSGAEEERTFVDFVRGRASGRDGKILELLVDYAQSDSFVTRRLQ